jgi:hypothetical protein
MITQGSVSREEAAARFSFLAESYPGRRKAMREFTHFAPDFVFWIYPDGRLYDARDAHRHNVPKGYEHILKDEPDYGGFLRGRIATLGDHQLIVVYCRSEALAEGGEKREQFVTGLARLPVPLKPDALVASDNGDIYGTVADLRDSGAAVPG